MANLLLRMCLADPWSWLLNGPTCNAYSRAPSVDYRGCRYSRKVGREYTSDSPGTFLRGSCTVNSTKIRLCCSCTVDSHQTTTTNITPTRGTTGLYSTSTCIRLESVPSARNRVLWIVQQCLRLDPPVFHIGYPSTCECVRFRHHCPYFDVLCGYEASPLCFSAYISNERTTRML